MSAYALPGSFFSSFPSLSEGVSSAPTGNLKQNGSSSNAVDKVSNIPGEKISTNCTIKHDQFASSSLVSSIEEQVQSESAQSNVYNVTHSTEKLLVSIKSATVDHIRLIQSFVTRKPSKNTSLARDTRDSTTSNSTWSYNNESDEQWGEYCDIEKEDDDYEASLFSSESQSSNTVANTSLSHQINNASEMVEKDLKQGDDHSISSENEMMTSFSSTRKNKAQNDAILFTLAIDFNGRKYTAKRTLMKFVKLRDDLIFELSKYRNKIDKEKVVIPELPIGTGTNKLEDLQNFACSTIGSASSGFSGLQAAVISFCPLMENWLRSVAQLAPFSTSLDHFLWEPIQNCNKIDCNKGEEMACRRSKQKMSSSSSFTNSSSKSLRRRHLSKRSMVRVSTLDSITEDVQTNSEGEN